MLDTLKLVENTNIEDESQLICDEDFKRYVRNIIVEKFDGNVFAYIKNLMETIDVLEETLNNATESFLKEAVAA